MRYHDMSVLSANEIRNEIGYQDRTDELGDKFVDEIEGVKQEAKNQQGNPPEGREERPDAPSQAGSRPTTIRIRLVAISTMRTEISGS